jgi:dTDP-4-amino-4,6-dideoxygalactose transaminase
MWPRKQLDISAADFLFAARQILASGSRPADDEIVDAAWIPPAEVFVCLSVRTGWDVLLTALDWPRGSEIVMSAVTIPDMARIAEHHGLVPVPIAVDAECLRPSPIDLEQAITSRTRAVLIAHLFGSRVDMEPLVAIARRHDLLVIEDCAQAYVGHGFAGHPQSDAAMFSFGPIKTATALGGAVLRIRDQRLRDCMDRLHRAYLLQSCLEYAARLAKYAALSAIGRRRVFAIVTGGMQWLGIDFDRAISGVAHSFSSRAFFQQIRRRPCTPLLRLLRRRLDRFASDNRVPRRIARGRWLASRLPPQTVLGAQNPTHTFWALPVRVPIPGRAVATLRAAGFDGTSRSSLVVLSPTIVDTPEDAGRLAPWLAETAFLPNGDAITNAEFDRMTTVLGTALRRVKVTSDSRYPTKTRVPAVT